MVGFELPARNKGISVTAGSWSLIQARSWEGLIQFGHPSIYIYYVYDMYRHVCTMYVHRLWIHPMKVVCRVYHVHTLHINVHRVYVHFHTLYMGTTDCLHTSRHYMPVCTALVTWMYYAIVQE